MQLHIAVFTHSHCWIMLQDVGILQFYLFIIMLTESGLFPVFVTIKRAKMNFLYIFPCLHRQEFSNVLYLGGKSWIVRYANISLGRIILNYFKLNNFLDFHQQCVRFPIDPHPLQILVSSNFLLFVSLVTQNCNLLGSYFTVTILLIILKNIPYTYGSFRHVLLL